MGQFSYMGECQFVSSKGSFNSSRFSGSFGGDFMNAASLNNPSYEYYPPKNINGTSSIHIQYSLMLIWWVGFNGTRIPSQFLVDTLNGNHYPIMVYLRDGTIFVAANTAAMIFDWKTNTETRLPGIPNGVRITWALFSPLFELPSDFYT